jgi:cytochrome c-type biogenesis protein
MIEISGILFAFSAGVFSLFSPCSYALLPGYISFYLGSEFSIKKGLAGGVASTLGLLSVFIVVGSLASILGEFIASIIPYLSLLAGGILITLGIRMIIQNRFFSITFNILPSKRKGYLGLYLFGVIYGFAGVGCSAPIFISILFYALSQGFINGILSFLVYALGMGLPLIVTSLLLAEGKELIIDKIRHYSDWIQKTSGFLLLMIGIYLIFYYKNTYL